MASLSKRGPATIENREVKLLFVMLKQMALRNVSAHNFQLTSSQAFALTMIGLLWLLNYSFALCYNAFFF